MPRPEGYIPKLCVHRASGRAYVKLDGKQRYCGRAGTAEAAREYNRLVVEWLARGKAPARAPSGSLAVLELFEMWAPTLEARLAGSSFRRVLPVLRRDLEALCGDMEASAFGVKAFKLLRSRWVERGLRASTARQYSWFVKDLFRWGGEEELIPGAIHEALSCVRPIRAGKEGTPEKVERVPVEDEAFEATMARCNPHVAAMARVQRLTGMRSGEVVVMRTGSIDRSGEVWVYRPEHYKGKTAGVKQKAVALGPKSQAVLAPWIARRPGASEYLFPGRGDGRPFSVRGYHQAIARACDEAGVPRWFPHLLRNTAATEIRRRFGIEKAQAVLGHANLKTTEIYSARALGIASEVAKEIG